MYAGLKIRQAPVPLVFAFMLALSLTTAGAQSDAQSARDSSAQPAHVAQNYGNLPLSFEANLGQTDPRVKFMSRGSGYGIYLSSDKAVLALNRKNCAGQHSHDLKPTGFVRGEMSCANTSAQVSMMLAGNASATAISSGEESLPGTVNYFVGSDPAAWRAGVPTYARVRYSGVYRGVDLLYYGNHRQLEYDFVVAPHADAKAIKLQFSGVSRMTIDADGNLILAAKNGDIAFRKPVIYQLRDGHRDLIGGRFTLGKRHSVGFAINDYDHSKPLVVDPVLAYSTYLGGSGTDGDEAQAIAVDSSGNAYIAGQTDSSNFPVTNGAVQSTDENTASGGYTAFVTKLNAAGTAVVYSTYLGGSGNTSAAGIAVDSSGDAYVTGHTFSSNYPVTSGAYETTSAASSTEYVAFITKLSAAGTALVYSTYLGGSGNGNGKGDMANAVAVDSSGNAYVAGSTYSPDFPTTSGAYQTTNQAVANTIAGGFAAKLNAAGSALVYSTFLSGSGSGFEGVGDSANAIAVDKSGDAYVTGSTGSSNFPSTAGAYLTANPAAAKGQTAAFVTELNSAGSALLYATYLGGSEDSSGNAIAVNPSGDAYVAGEALFTDFPVTTGAYQTANNASAGSATNAFITELNATGTGLIYSTWLGGSGVAINADVHSGDSADAIALDASGDAYIAGTAYSSNFPVTGDAVQSSNEAAANKASNAFVTELNSAGNALLYSSYLGGSGYPFGTRGFYHGDNATGLALDSYDNVYVTGTAFSANFPATSGALQSNNLAAGTSGSNAFVTQVSIAPLVATTTSLASSLNPAGEGLSVTFTAVVTPGTGSTTPAGSVIFVVDGSVASTVPLNEAGSAAYITSSLAAGTHTVTASYSGSSSFSTSTSSNLSETVNAPLPATLTAPASGTTFAGPSAAFTWTAGSQGSTYGLWLGSAGAGSNNLGSSGSTSSTSVTFGAIPTNGEAIYLRLFTITNGITQYNDYTFAAATQAAMSSPAPGSTFVNPSATFTWTAGTEATSYTLWLGTSGVGSNNLYGSGATTATSVSLTSLPTSGATIYARLYTTYGSTSVHADYTYVAASAAVITTPTPGSALTEPSATFTWPAFTGAGSYSLLIGSTGVGSSNLYNSGSTTATSVKFSSVPTNGETIYVRLITTVNGVAARNDYTYVAPSAAVLISPASGVTFTAPSATFHWTAGSGAASYTLWLGTTAVGSNNLWSSGAITATSVTFGGLPTNGQTIYARLFTTLNGALLHFDYTYTAASEAALTSPAAGSTLAGSSATFTWNAVPGAASYTLWLGTTGVGSNNLGSSGATTATSFKYGNLPTNGGTIYARLFTNYGSTELHSDYTFTAY